MAILETHNMAVGYGQGKRRKALISNLNLALEQGSMVALLGMNGAGKSTLIRALTCDTQPIEGELLINGNNATTISKKEISRLIALVATERIMGGGFTIWELVALGRHPHTGLLGRLSSHDREVVDKCLDDVGITHLAHQHVASLSDGERQKAMIAKALAQQTPIIVLDEPTAFLDVASRIECMRLLHKLAREQSKAVLLSSHDISQSLLLADELWVITRERNLITGTTEQVVMSGAMNKVFDNASIVFNSNLCDYEAQLPVVGSVKLSCNDLRLRRCMVNALLRNGVAINEDSHITLRVNDIDDITTSTGHIIHNIKDIATLFQ